MLKIGKNLFIRLQQDFVPLCSTDHHPLGLTIQIVLNPLPAFMELVHQPLFYEDLTTFGK